MNNLTDTYYYSHMKYVSKKKNGPVKTFNYLQINGTSNYDYDSVVRRIQELMVNGAIDQSYKIINPVTEVLNLVTDVEVEICSEISGTHAFDSQPFQVNSYNITTPIVYVTTTLILNTAITPNDHSDDMETYIKSLQDKCLVK